MGRQRLLSWLGVLGGVSVLAGLACALLWARLVHLPSYEVRSDHVAVMSEYGYRQVFASDAWFVVIGLAAGLLLGGIAWSWFKTIGWPAGPLAMATGLVAGLVCWTTGQLWGPGPFDDRLAHAAPGDQVRIAFQLHTPVAIVAWGLAALLPGLFLAALGPEVAPGPAGGMRGRADDAPLAATGASAAS